MITQVLTHITLAAASASDLKEIIYQKQSIPNLYFLPLPLIQALNPSTILPSLIVLGVGIVFNKLQVTGFADVLAFTTITAAGHINAIPYSLVLMYLGEKTVYRNQEKYPALPLIYLGYIIFLATNLIQIYI